MSAPRGLRRRTSHAIVAAFVTLVVMVGGLAGARASEPEVTDVPHGSGTSAVVEATDGAPTAAPPEDPGRDPSGDDAGEVAGDEATNEAGPVAGSSVADPGSPPADVVATDSSRAAPPDLLVRTSAPGRVARGEAFTRTFTVRNRGGQTATGIEITARLPVGVRIVGVLPEMEGGTCTVVSVAGDPTVIAVCNRRSLVPGEEASMHLTLEATTAARCGPLVVTAAARASNEPSARIGPENRGRVPDRLVCARVAGPDLSVSMASDAQAIERPGARFEYLIEVRNDGDATARHVSIEDSLPRGVRAVGLPTVGGGVCTVAASIDSGGTERWSITCRVDELAAGQTVALTASVQVIPDPPCGPAINVVEVAARNEPEANIGDENRAQLRIALACPPSLEVEIVTPKATHADSIVGVRVAVRNAGGTVLRDIRALETPCGPSTFGRLEPGQTRTAGCRLPITSTVEDPVRLTVTFAGRDQLGQRAVGRASASIDVLHPAIGLTVTADPASGTPGGLVTYTYVVRNLGDTPLSGVAIRDPAVDGVGRAVTLAPGTARTSTVSTTLPSSAGAVVRTVVVRASDRLGREVTATAPLSVTVVRAGSPSTGGTAFTGADIGRTSSIVIALMVAGLVAVVAARRRPTTDAD